MPIPESFRAAVEPAMKWLAENKGPHAKIIIDSGDAELVVGEIAHRTDKFIKD